MIGKERKARMKTQTKTNESGSFAMRVLCESFTIIRLLGVELCHSENPPRTTSPKGFNFYSKSITNRHLSGQIRPGTILTISWAHPNNPKHIPRTTSKKGQQKQWFLKHKVDDFHPYFALTCAFLQPGAFPCTKASSETQIFENPIDDNRIC